MSQNRPIPLLVYGQVIAVTCVDLPGYGLGGLEARQHVFDLRCAYDGHIMLSPNFAGELADRLHVSQISH
jgi:hypothetical protein